MSSRLVSLLEMLEKEPDDSFLMYAVALEYISAGDLYEAEKFLKKLIAADPGYTAAYMQYAQLKEKQDKIDEAKELYKKGIDAANKAGDKKTAKEMEDFLNDLE
jgi:Tfp pilus assembly protein PilF